MRTIRPALRRVILISAIAAATRLHAGSAPQVETAAALLRENRCEEADEIFGRVLAATPEDVEAIYGRGLSRICLGEFDAAVDDLTRVVAQRPDDPRAALDLGAALTSAGDYDAAAIWLRKAGAAAGLEGPATLLLGFGQLNAGDLDAARRSFAEAQRLAPQLEDQARYYSGVAEYRAGNLTAAEEYFRQVAANRPHSPLGLEAERFADAVRRERGADYQLRGALGFEYDSNVVLAPIDDLIRDENLGNLADERFTVAADVRWVAWRSSAVRAEIGYAFFQSVHFDLDEFDLQSHHPAIDISHRHGPFRIGFNALYEFYLRSRSLDLFVQQWTLRPSVSLEEGSVGETEVFYRVRDRSFFDDDFDELDGYNVAPGIVQNFWLGNRARRLSLAYTFDSELLDDQYRTPPYDPEQPPPPPVRSENEFAYDGHEVTIGASAFLPAEIFGSATYAFRHEDYGPGSRFTNDDGERERRDDDRHTVSVSLSRTVWRNVSAGAGYYGAFNRSNDDTFSYDRHVGFLTVSTGF